MNRLFPALHLLFCFPHVCTTTIMSSNPWAPDETPEQLFAENAWLQGALLCAVAYGCELTLFSMCFYLLYKQRKRSASKRRTIGLLIYITFIFLLGSLFLASNNEFTQLAFITNRNYPGGPGQFETDMFSIPADEVSNVSFVLSNWSADLLIVRLLTFAFSMTDN